MEVDLKRLRADVVGRHIRVDAGVDAHRPHRDAALSAQLGNRLGQQFDIELEPERRDVARLLVPEQVPGAADLEIAHGNREPGAEFRVIGERRQPRPRLRRQLRHVRVEQVCVRGHVGTSDASTDLVELRKTERVGALDDQRVRLRDVEAGLDDRRRHEHVRVAAQEGVHLLLQLAFAHLAVRDEEAKRRAQLLELLGDLVDRLDPVVQVERLPLPFVLALERLPDQVFVVFGHGRADRPATLRRRLDDRDVAEAGERHVQRARDRRRAQRQHVDLEPERPQQLLLRDAEALLLVEDDEAELLRDHVAGQDAVRADQNLDLAGLEVGQHLFDVLRRAEARDHLDADREVAVARAERVPVLLGEDRRRREHQHLLAVDRDGERGPDRDLGLAEADVAADEAVHRARRLQVLLDRLDRVLLVGRLTVGELGLQPLEPVVPEVVRHAGRLLPFRIEREQFAGELAHALARPRLQVVPRLPAELRQRGRRRVRADVPRDLSELLVRDV